MKTNADFHKNFKDVPTDVTGGGSKVSEDHRANRAVPRNRRNVQGKGRNAPRPPPPPAVLHSAIAELPLEVFGRNCGYLTTASRCALRLTCRRAQAALDEHQQGEAWEEADRIRQRISTWTARKAAWTEARESQNATERTTLDQSTALAFDDCCCHLLPAVWAASEKLIEKLSQLEQLVNSGGSLDTACTQKWSSDANHPPIGSTFSEYRAPGVVVDKLIEILCNYFQDGTFGSVNLRAEEKSPTRLSVTVRLLELTVFSGSQTFLTVKSCKAPFLSQSFAPMEFFYLFISALTEDTEQQYSTLQSRNAALNFICDVTERVALVAPKEFVAEWFRRLFVITPERRCLGRLYRFASMLIAGDPASYLQHVLCIGMGLKNSMQVKAWVSRLFRVSATLHALWGRFVGEEGTSAALGVDVSSATEGEGPAAEHPCAQNALYWLAAIRTNEGEAGGSCCCGQLVGVVDSVTLSDVHRARFRYLWRVTPPELQRRLVRRITPLLAFRGETQILNDFLALHPADVFAARVNLVAMGNGCGRDLVHGDTALHAALRRPAHAGVARLLVAHGADPLALNCEDERPIHLLEPQLLLRGVSGLGAIDARTLSLNSNVSHHARWSGTFVAIGGPRSDEGGSAAVTKMSPAAKKQQEELRLLYGELVAAAASRQPFLSSS